MRKPLWIIPSLILFAAIGAPNASADTVDPSIMTKTTNTMGILSDMATLSGVIGMSPGTFTFTLTDPNGAMVGLGISGMQPVSASGVPVTAASAVIQTAPGEYTWMVTFAPNPGFPAVDKATEIQVVTTPEPDIGALMLAGIGFLLVMRKRCASGLTPTSYWAFLSIHSMCFT